ncbi:MAG: DUF2480 family protein [Flavobacteriaceae bacterium]|nr:DUF2480 family protein [Flavobacteriaceae bacterium]
MAEEIKNKVAESKLITLDLQDYYLEGQRSQIDVAQWLEEGLILREKSFRQAVNSFDFSVFKNHFVALHCSTDAIIPVWAYMLLTSKLTGVAQAIVFGDLQQLESFLMRESLSRLDLSAFSGKNIIVKGCFEKPIPSSAYVQIMQQLSSVANAVFYGEACSSVPVFKKPKSV